MSNELPFCVLDSDHELKNEIFRYYKDRKKALKIISFIRWRTQFEKIGKLKGFNLVGAFCPNGHFVESIQFLDHTNRYYCEKCRSIFSPVYDTIFEQSRVPLWKWFIFVRLYYDFRDSPKTNIPSGRKIALEIKVSNRTGCAMKKLFEKNIKTEKKFISSIFYGIIEAIHTT